MANVRRVNVDRAVSMPPLLQFATRRMSTQVALRRGECNSTSLEASQGVKPLFLRTYSRLALQLTTSSSSARYSRLAAGSAVWLLFLHFKRSGASCLRSPRSSMSEAKTSFHRSFGLPRALFPSIFISCPLLATASGSRLSTCPNQRRRLSFSFSPIGAVPIYFLTSSFVCLSRSV